MSIIDFVNPSPIRVYHADVPVSSARKIPFQDTIRPIKDAWEGLSSSRTIRALVGGAMGWTAFLVATLALAYFSLTPPGWMSAAMIVGAVVLFAVLGLLSGGSGSRKKEDVLQELGCEWGAFKELLPNVRCLRWGFEYNEIKWDGQKTLGKIFLGPMPNRLHLTQSPKQIAKKEHLAGVLSINAPGFISEKGERGPYGLMHPSTAKDWHALGVQDYAEIDIADHIPLSLDQLDAAADFIHATVMRLSSHNNIYVHCKAGLGRSAMAVAAYLMKYGKFNKDQAVNIIEDCRHRVTLRKPRKMDKLSLYQKRCHVL